MEYIRISEAAKKWGISDRRVRALAAKGRIPGVVREGNLYKIPAGAPKPRDGRNERVQPPIAIASILKERQASLSFEVFPPKSGDTYESVRTATEQIAILRPHFMSVTYGAGGTTEKYTAAIAGNLLRKYGVTPVAHLTCIAAKRTSLHAYLDELRAEGIGNVLALRGDIPTGAEDLPRDYRYARDLVSEIALRGDFCIGCACYPEGHPESPSQKEDIAYLREKVDAGCHFMTSQMFFDNNIFYNFLYKVRDAGITIPVIAGIMPVTNASQIRRICSLSGTALPARFRQIVDRYGNDPDAMKQAGIAYATEQIVDLYANGVRGVHVYSMNKPDVAERIRDNLSAIIK